MGTTLKLIGGPHDGKEYRSGEGNDLVDHMIEDAASTPLGEALLLPSPAFKMAEYCVEKREQIADGEIIEAVFRL